MRFVPITFCIIPQALQFGAEGAGVVAVEDAEPEDGVAANGERADVVVSAGTVEIRFRGHDVKLATDQSWSSERPSDVVTP